LQFARSADDERWFAVTNLTDPSGIEARVDELLAMSGEAPRLVLAFGSSKIPRPQLREALDRALPDTSVVGCTTSGLVHSEPSVGGEIQLVVLGGPGFGVETALTDYESGCRAAGQLVGQVVPSGEELNRTLMLLCDGLEGDVADLVRGAYSVCGAGVSIVGGCAGDDLAMEQTFQFVDDHWLSGGVAAAGLTSTGPIGIGVAHGWAAVGEPMVVTASDGTSVLTLDDVPALDQYLSVVGADHTFESSADFARFAQTRPLGLDDGGSGQVRFVTGGDFERRSLDFLVHIPEGQLAWVMNGDRQSVIDATMTSARQALAQLDGRPPLGVVAFDCVARRSVVGAETVADEIEALKTPMPLGTPIGGFYTYGEIARTGGALGLHHQTMVVAAFG
jgi:hypothetical protein